MERLFNIINISLPFLCIIILVTAIPILIVGCSSSSSEYKPEKMDTPLQQKIRELDKDNTNTIIQFTGKTSMPINDEMTTKLKSTGLTIESIISDIFTASGTTESIKKITMYDFVVYLELAQKLNIK
jgi:hypothetical protein